MPVPCLVPRVPDALLRARARELLQVFHRRGLLPHTLKFLVALGDLDDVRACFDERGRLRPDAAGAGRTDERFTVNEGFMYACRYRHEPVAAFLLERCIALDPELGRNDRRLARTCRVRRIHGCERSECG